MAELSFDHWHRKRHRRTFPITVRTSVEIEDQKECGCGVIKSGPFYNTLTNASLVEMWKLVLGTSSNHLSRDRIHLRLLQGGGQVGPQWITSANTGPTVAASVEASPSHAVLFTFVDDGPRSYDVSELQLWVGVASGSPADNYGLLANGYQFNEVDLPTNTVNRKVPSRNRTYRIRMEFFARDVFGFTDDLMEDFINCITGESAAHFDRSNVFLRPMSDASTELPGQDLAPFSAPELDTDDYSVTYHFRAPDGIFNGDWAEVGVKHQRPDNSRPLVRAGPCRRDGTGCGMKAEEWDYYVKFSFKRGVGRLPRIRAFQAVSDRISAGEQSTLRWVTERATTLEINQGVGSVMGTEATVRPTETTTYTLTATNTYGTVSADATVTLREKPAINSFTAIPPSISVGDNTRLQWTITGATSAWIDQGVGTVDENSGEVTVTPTVDTTYRLTAMNDAGMNQEEVTVYVTARPQAPPITTFRVEPDIINEGQSATLHWQVLQGSSDTRVRIFNQTNPRELDRRDVGLGGQQTVTPEGTSIYVIEARNSAGVSTQSATLTVGECTDLPIIQAFTVDDRRPSRGETIRFDWVVTGEVELYLSRDGVAGDERVDVLGRTSFDVLAPTMRTIYTLRAINECGQVTSNVAIIPEERCDPPTIFSFGGSSDVAPGARLNLSFSVASPPAHEVEISSTQPGFQRRTFRAQDLPDNNYEFSVPDSEAGNSLQYTLAAKRRCPDGSEAISYEHHTVRVLQAAIAPAITRFEAVPARVTRDHVDRNQNNVEFSWDVTDRTSLPTSLELNLNGVRHDVTGRSTFIERNVRSPIRAVLRAANSAGSVTDTVNVEVEPTVPCPVVLAFQKNRDATSDGRAVILSWDTSNTDVVRIYENYNPPDLGTLVRDTTSGSGTFTVNPTADTTYGIVASSSGVGCPDAAESLRVPLCSIPRVSRFRSSDDSPSVGQTITITWATSNADTVEITATTGQLPPALRNVATSGSESFEITTTTEFLLTATNECGSISINLPISVGGLL